MNGGTVLEHCDVLIIGAGPAGMAAAVAAAPSSASIWVIDDNPAPGGQIWRDGPGVALPGVAQRWRATPTSACSVAPASWRCPRRTR